MKTNKRIWLVVSGLVIFFLIVILLIPGIRHRLMWQWEIAKTYLGGVVNPVEAVPTALPTPEPTATTVIAAAASPTPQPSETPVITATALPTSVPTATPTPIPGRVVLPSPRYEVQDINNCGPASLSMYLNFYGWEGDQFSVSDVIKPIPQDRNVNIEELDYFVKNYAGWLNTIYRVGGDIDLLKELIAAGVPVMIEETFHFAENYWPNDDRWAGHYLLLNGYDDERQSFLVQDSFHGPDRWITYEETDRNWQAFNRVYTVVYLPQQEETIKAILGDNWDADVNRQNALEIAQQETELDPENVYAWFNLGSNYAYFEDYHSAVRAYDQAREIGWPQRMLRYQFGPFMAYFHSLRNEDLMVLVEYALDRTPNSEEALLWQGWGYYRSGETEKAIESFNQALEAHPDYLDAIYALNFVSNN